jgi:3-isopropylmalate/(R)-2-methylmalate dehydratase small subunit
MSLSKLRGRAAWIFEERDFDIDLIIGVENIKLSNPDDLVAVTMKSYDAQFTSEVRKGDLLVGGENFGYGHPHYPAMKAMRHLGVAGVIAESFSPGFFRGEISMGFPLVTCPGVLQLARRWDELEVDWAASTVTNLTTGRQLGLQRLSSAESATLEAGGLVPYLKKRLQQAHT